MADFHKTRRIAAIRDLAAKFFGERSNRSSLITVTKATLSADRSAVSIGVTILPDSQQEAALDFAKRHLGDLRQYIGTHAKIGNVPYLTIEIDGGEKNRQRVDELLAQDGANKE